MHSGWPSAQKRGALSSLRPQPPGRCWYLMLGLLLVPGCLQQLPQVLLHHVLPGGSTQGGPHTSVQEVLQQSQGVRLC